VCKDIIDYADLYKIEGAIIFIDFSKAFDSLDWDFMFILSINNKQMS
jgi:hypothetical protein